MSREASEILADRALGAMVGALSGPGHSWERGYASSLPHRVPERGWTLLAKGPLQERFKFEIAPFNDLEKAWGSSYE